MINVIMLPASATCQDKGSVEQFYYTGAGSSTVVPRIFYQSTKNWLGEIRYNYEELQSISFNAGKMFSVDRGVDYSVTPYGGLVMGKLNGGTLGSNVAVEYEKLFFSSEAQYTFSVENRIENFFYNWSEAGYEISDLLYAGVALQFTQPYQLASTWEPGVTMGLTFGAWTVPLYAFSIGNKKRNYVLGINWEWKYERNSKKAGTPANKLYL